MTKHQPLQILTKELQIQTGPTQQRRIRVSTNLLPRFGFAAGTRLEAQTRNNGFDLVTTQNPEARWKVHTRHYPQRKNNPSETQIDIQSNAFIARCVPNTIERLHFTFRHGRIEARLVQPQLFHIRRAFRQTPPAELMSFLALSSGLDAVCLHDAGFTLGGLLEWRPIEARDGQRDLTESGVTTFVANHQPQIVINEDITTVNLQHVKKLCQPLGPLALLSIGLQCDDFSTAKSAELKRAEIAEFRPSSRELGYYATKLIETLEPATILIENVTGWHGSQAQAILGAVLRRLGYHVQAKILKANDFGACTKRNRCYLVASCWPGYQFPNPTGSQTRTLAEILGEELNNCRDVSHTKTIAAAKTSPWKRFCKLSATATPTILKSQARQTKDSLFFEDNQGRILKPSLKALQILQGFHGKINLSQVSEEIATEQIGQGVDYQLHHAVSESLKHHIQQNTKQKHSCQMQLNIK